MINILPENGMENGKKQIIRKWLIALGAIFLILLIAGLYIYYDVEKKYADRIIPGVYAGNIDLSGLSRDQAQMILDQKIKQIETQGIKFSYQNNQTSIYPFMASTTSEIVFNYFSFEADKNINEALAYGHDGSIFKRFQARVNVTLKNKHLPIYATVNDGEVENFLRENFSRFENLGTNATLVYADGGFTIQDEKKGEHIAFRNGIEILKANLSELNQSDIALFSEIDIPQILKENCIGLEAEALKIASNTPFTLFYKDEEWKIEKDTLANLLALKIEPRFSVLKDKIIIGLNQEKTTLFFNEEIAPDVNIKAIEPKFEVINGRVTEFQGSRDGVEVNIEETIKKIETDIMEGCLSGKKECDENAKKIELAITETKSEIKTSEVNNLGIKEIIGSGHSSFKGSPANRRHNIATGAAAVNGTMVKPNEEFSLIKTLGAIDAESGYLPELVIKDNKTIPEFGGGLCQVGTTVFRATFNSGLPVTSRRNHSYRVSYYEPAGTDATIYDPNPDYKFLNDTPYNILIQSRIEGDNLYFDFWSTEDGRIASSTYPTIYNIVKPAPTKIVETLDLKPGVKKCTESSHNGADAYFDYTVTYPNGEVKNSRFSSHYVPWRAVCLLGVEKLTETETSTDPQSASSTPATATTPTETKP
ncbi:MAG: VanW family protein [Candidatus Magasanikbacteria bacterium]|nr:VanW family protein [Candidatus Magasanikbacteria bacterium]